MAQYPTPVYPTWGQSLGQGIGQGFESIMQGMQRAQQNKIADRAFSLQTGITPQDFQAGQNTSQQLQQMGNPQNQMQQPPVQAPQGPITIGQSPLPQSQMDVYQHFQNVMGQARQGNQAKSNLENANAALSNRYVQNLGGQPAPMVGMPGQPQVPQSWQAPSPKAVPPSGLQDSVGSTEPMIHTDPQSGRQYTIQDTKTGPQIKWAPSAGGSKSSASSSIKWGDAMDLSKASNRQPLGIAVINNQKSQRATSLLEKKGTYTPQDQSLVITDLTSIMKGGSPDEELLRSQQYGSLYQNGIRALQNITANPQNLNVPETRQHLLEIVQGMNKINNDTIRNHIDASELTYSDQVKANPEKAAKLRKNAEKMLTKEEPSSQSSQSTPPPGYELHRNKRTGEQAYVNPTTGDMWKQPK